MSTDRAANTGAAAVRQTMRFDERALAQWMSAHVDGFCGPIAVTQFKGGQSNPTYRLQTPGAGYVLRRKPPGLLVKGAHDVLREARILAALQGSSVKTPKVLAVCEDDTVIGTSFFIMEFVDGRIFWDASFGEVPKDRRRDYFDAMNATIAALHAVDPSEVGLDDFGRRGAYCERQIKRWTQQYLEDADAGRHPDMDALVEWLPGAVPPEEEVRITHGDFRCDNLIFHRERPDVIAVLDWELSTLGDPCADFVYHALMYRVPGDIVAGLGGVDPAPLGIPTERDYVRAYETRSGRDVTSNWNFYAAFNLFRLAAIFHGIKGRVLRGTASSEHAAERARQFPRLAELAGQAFRERLHA